MSIQIKKQQRTILVIVVTLIILLIGLFAFFGNQSGEKGNADTESYKKHVLASPISSDTNEAHWIEKTQNAWKEEQKKSSLLDKNIRALAEKKEAQDKRIESQNEEMTELKAMLKDLRIQVSRMQAEKNQVSNSINSSNSSNRRGEFHGKDSGTSNNLPRADMEVEAGRMELESGFIQYSANLSKSAKPRIKTPENYVFSNTFAKAVVLMGADASAGVLNQDNPDIMMFQIIDDGIMPNRQKSRLNGCFFSASVVGDISSERGKLRTERLSCIHADGTSIDTRVTGIVSDSKNGIRGRAVWREQPMVNRAFWGTFWESMGNIGQQYATDVSISPLGSVSTIDPSRIPLAAASSGGSGAAKMYAQYNIKRAEMYHPIIQLPPGTIVDVTFLKGFWLDGGDDEKEPETLVQTQKARFENPALPESAEAREARAFFYKNHSF